MREPTAVLFPSNLSQDLQSRKNSWHPLTFRNHVYVCRYCVFMVLVCVQTLYIFCGAPDTASGWQSAAWWTVTRYLTLILFCKGRYTFFIDNNHPAPSTTESVSALPPGPCKYYSCRNPRRTRGGSWKSILSVLVMVSPGGASTVYYNFVLWPERNIFTYQRFVTENWCFGYGGTKNIVLPTQTH